MRCEGGRDCMKVIHKPTGISRGVGPPLPNPRKSQHEMLGLIEAELVARGLTQYILPAKERRK